MNVSQLRDLASAIDRIQTAMVDHGVSPILGQSFDINVSDGEQVTLSVLLEDASDESSWYLDAAMA